MEVSEERGRVVSGALRRAANGGPLLIAIRSMDMPSPSYAFRTAAPKIDLDLSLEATIRSRAHLPTVDRRYGLVVEVRVVESVWEVDGAGPEVAMHNPAPVNLLWAEAAKEAISW